MAMAELDPVRLDATAEVTTPGTGLTPFYSNRFYIRANDQIMRFVIGDSVSGQDLSYNLCFVMTRADAAGHGHGPRPVLK